MDAVLSACDGSSDAADAVDDATVVDEPSFPNKCCEMGRPGVRRGESGTDDLEPERCLPAAAPPPPAADNPLAELLWILSAALPDGMRRANASTTDIFFFLDALDAPPWLLEP